jgi:hypothetical protein
LHKHDWIKARSFMTKEAHSECWTAEEQVPLGPILLQNQLGNLLAFFIPALQFLQVQTVGTLYATDLLSLVVFLFAFLSSVAGLNRRLPRVFLSLGLVWFLAQVTTDLLRATAFADYARGWAMIAFTLTNFAALYLLLSQNGRRIIPCALGFVVGDILTYFVNPDVYAALEPWKFGYGYGVTLFIILVATIAAVRSKALIAALIMLSASVINLYMGYRSLGGECFIVAAYLLVRQIARSRRERGREMTLAGALIGSALLVLAASGVLRIYEYYAGNGMLGHNAWEKYEVESSGRYGVLMGGRTEFVVGIEAALDSPIIGHGSWAKDWRYASRIESLRSEAGYGAIGSVDSWLIPTHSYLIGAWVSAGILGLVFWLWVLSIPARALARLYKTAEPRAPLIAFLAVGLIWNLLFSPYGAAERFSAPFAIVTLMWLLESYPLHEESIA